MRESLKKAARFFSTCDPFPSWLSRDYLVSINTNLICILASWSNELIIGDIVNLSPSLFIVSTSLTCRPTRLTTNCAPCWTRLWTSVLKDLAWLKRTTYQREFLNRKKDDVWIKNKTYMALIPINITNSVTLRTNDETWHLYQWYECKQKSKLINFVKISPQKEWEMKSGTWKCCSVAFEWVVMALFWILCFDIKGGASSWCDSCTMVKIMKIGLDCWTTHAVRL